MQLAYDLKRKKLRDVDVVLPDEIKDRHGTVFTDNFTLMGSFSLFSGSPLERDPDEGWKETKRNIATISKNPGPMSALNLIQNVVLYDQLVVDGFVLANDEASMAAAKLFPTVIKALYLSDAQRMRIGNALAPSVTALNRLDAAHPDLEEAAKFNAYTDIEQELFQAFSRRTPPTDIKRAHAGEVLTIHVPDWLGTSSEHLARTFFYVLLARACRVPYAPHPARCPLLEACAQKQIDAARDAILRFEQMLDSFGSEVSKTFRGYDLRLEIPPVAQYIIHRTDRRSELAEQTLEVRDSQHAKEFRKWCSELQRALHAGSVGVEMVQRLHGELEKACEIWSKDVRNHVNYRRRALRITSLKSILGEVEAEVKDPILFGGGLRHLLLLNDLVRGLS